MDLIMDIPKNIKHYDFKRVIIENIVDNYYVFIEDCRISTIHKQFLNTYNLDKSIIWLF